MVKSKNLAKAIILFTLRESREYCISCVAKGFAVNYYSFTLGRLGSTALSIFATMGIIVIVRINRRLMLKEAFIFFTETYQKQLYLVPAGLIMKQGRMVVK